MAPSPVLNPEAIQALRDLSPEGDAEFLRELITIYLEDTPKQLALLETALEKADALSVVRTSHTLKGSAGNFGAARFAQMTLEMENHAKAGAMAAAAALLPALLAQHALVVDALKQLAARP